jgi:uncharacterized protein (TIGR03435 family)
VRALVLPALCIVAFGQDANTKFEVASVRVSTSNPGPGMAFRGGPGTSDPERFSAPDVPLKLLVRRAFAREEYQISCPDWLDSIRVEIVAKVPPGATKEQLNAMLQTLLVERFNLTFHHETKEMSVYELSVGSSGSKLKDADHTPPPEREPGSRGTIVATDKDGFLDLPRTGQPMMFGNIKDGIQRWTASMQDIASLTSLFGVELQRPVVDKTELKGEYDFKLAYSREGLVPRRSPAGSATDDTPTGGPTLLKAVQDQLGLKLESAKDPIDILVIDHIDKIPTDN